MHFLFQSHDMNSPHGINRHPLKIDLLQSRLILLKYTTELQYAVSIGQIEEVE